MDMLTLPNRSFPQNAPLMPLKVFYDEPLPLTISVAPRIKILTEYGFIQTFTALIM